MKHKSHPVTLLHWSLCVFLLCLLNTPPGCYVSDVMLKYGGRRVKRPSMSAVGSLLGAFCKQMMLHMELFT